MIFFALVYSEKKKLNIHGYHIFQITHNKITVELHLLWHLSDCDGWSLLLTTLTHYNYLSIHILTTLCQNADSFYYLTPLILLLFFSGLEQILVIMTFQFFLWLYILMNLMLLILLCCQFFTYTNVCLSLALIWHFSHHVLKQQFLQRVDYPSYCIIAGIFPITFWYSSSYKG